MGTKRPIRDSVKQQYAQELNVAEQWAQVGFDKNKQGPDRINPSVYGPTSFGGVDPIAEMKALQAEGLIDPTIVEESMKEFNRTVPIQPKQDNRVADAMAAVKAEAAQKAPESPKPVAPAPQATPAPESAQELSRDPAERMEQVAGKLAEQFPNAPSANQLKQWKAMHGDLYLLPIDDKVFIYRYLKRQEWSQMQANTALQELRPDQQEDVIFNKCLLWPALEPHIIAGMPAGAVSMIVEQIRMQSMFLDPVQVASITLKL